MKANIIQDNTVKYTTSFTDTTDTFYCLAWAHRMGYDVIEVSSTMAKLETVEGNEAILDISFVDH